MEEMLRALDVPSFAIKSPIVVDRIGKRDGLALDDWPSCGITRTGRSRFPFRPLYADPLQLVRGSLRPCVPRSRRSGRRRGGHPPGGDNRPAGRGCDFIQLDEPILSQVVFGEENTETFMCAALPNRRDPTDELELAVRLMNQTTEGISGIKTGVHVCRGNWSRREDVLLAGNYGPMLPYLTQMNIDQLVLECATPRAGRWRSLRNTTTSRRSASEW